MFGFSFAASEDDEPKEEAQIRISPPKNFREWLERQGLSEWPLSDCLDKQSAQMQPEKGELSLHPATILGELEDIRRDLSEHAGCRFKSTYSRWFYAISKWFMMLHTQFNTSATYDSLPGCLLMANVVYINSNMAELDTLMWNSTWLK